MESINLDQLRQTELDSNSAQGSTQGLGLDEIKHLENNLKALFADNVNEIHLKTKWTRDEHQNGHPTIACKLTKEVIYMQQKTESNHLMIKYKYHIKRDELIENNTIVIGDGKARFFKKLVKLIEWAEAEKCDVAFK